MEICIELNIPCKSTNITQDELLNADEVFTATTAGGLTPVTKINNNIFGNDAIGPITATILKTYWAWHAEESLLERIDYL